VVFTPPSDPDDQQKAWIEQGEELPYSRPPRRGATHCRPQGDFVKLEVNLLSSPLRQVILDVDVTKDSVGRRPRLALASNTKHVQTQVPGRTVAVVIGGSLNRTTARTSTQGSPFLGEFRS